MIDATTGAHLWADKFEGELEETFDLQDKVTVSVVGAIAPRLIEADMERAGRKPLESWDSYDFYLRGLALYAERNRQANEQALPLFRKAISRQPDFGLAYTRTAACIFLRTAYGGPALSVEDRCEVLQLNDRALLLEPNDASVVGWASLIIGLVSGDLDRASDYSDRALTINPNLSNAWNARGWISYCIDEAQRSLEAFDYAIRLNPLDAWTVDVAMRGRCSALWGLGRHHDVAEQAKKLIARSPNDLHPWLAGGR